MKVHVVMGNDFPAAVFSTEEAAEKFIEKMKAQDPRRKFGPGIHWRAYDFELDCNEE